jgi:ABC-2 type transport system ATP-binding protein
VAVVALQDLSKAYGSGPDVLQDLTLEIPPGVTGLLGPNGAGKSTLLQCVLGLLPDYRGRVTVLGLDARRDRRAIRRRVGFMPESDATLPGMTGIQAVRYLGQLTGLPRDEALRRAHEVLHHVGLGEAIYRHVREYSTGMRQRFKLATALVHDPELIFLDEPLAGMDPRGRTELLGLIGDLAREHGKHIVWSSHILPDVERVADAVVVLHRGRYRGRFALQDLRRDRHQLEVEFEGAAEPFLAALAAVEVEAREEHASSAGLPAGRRALCAAAPGEDGATRVLQAAHAAGVRVRRVAVVAEDLEQVFLRLLEDGDVS